MKYFTALFEWMSAKFEKLEDRYLPPSYEDWSVLQMTIAILLSFITLLFSPRWMMEIADRSWGTFKAKMRGEDMDTFYEKRAQESLDAFERGER